MVVCRKPLILAIDVAGIGVIGLALLSTLSFVVIPTQREAAELPAALTRLQSQRDALEASQQVLARIEAHSAELQVDRERELAKLNVDDGALMAQLADQCRTFNVQLAAIEPGATEQGGRAFRVRARGRFSDVLSVIRSLETASPYVHIANLELVAGPDDAGRECDAGWMVRLPNAPDASPPAASAPTPGTGVGS